MQKQKLQMPPQPPPPQAQSAPPQPTAQVQVQASQPPQQQSPQLTTVTAPRPGALLTGTTVANLQVARLVSVSFCLFSKSSIFLCFNTAVALAQVRVTCYRSECETGSFPRELSNPWTEDGTHHLWNINTAAAPRAHPGITKLLRA